MLSILFWLIGTYVLDRFSLGPHEFFAAITGGILIGFLVLDVVVYFGLLWLVVFWCFRGEPVGFLWGAGLGIALVFATIVEILGEQAIQGHLLVIAADPLWVVEISLISGLFAYLQARFGVLPWKGFVPPGQ